MKKIILFALIAILISCKENKSYYEQLKEDKPFVSRISDLNKPFEVVRSEEKGKLVKEDVNFLKYVYSIGKNDTYVVSYLFDEKGCYEIGIDGYFEFEEDATNVVKGIQLEMDSSQLNKVSEDNYLSRWNNTAKSIGVELDYKDKDRGLFVATIFANE